MDQNFTQPDVIFRYMKPPIEKMFLMKTKYNTILYIAFILLGIYFAVFRGNPMQLIVNWGIALIFDPFDPDMPWKERPRWQKAILFTHIALMIIIFIYANQEDIRAGITDGWNGK
jgi:hypothetical protein